MDMKFDLEEMIKKDMKINDTAPSQLVDNVLSNMEECHKMKKKPSVVRKIAAAAICVILAGGGLTYAASQYWNENVMDDLGLKDDKDKRAYLEKGGYVSTLDESDKEEKLSDTDKDITVEVQQVIADQNNMYVYIKATFGEKYDKYKLYKKIKKEYYPNPGMDMQVYDADTGEENSYTFHGDQVLLKELPKDRSVLYRYSFKGNFDNKNVKLKIKGFYFNNSMDKEENDKDAYEGNWEVSFTPSVGKDTYVYHIDKEFCVKGYQLKLKTLKVTPLSCFVELEAKEKETWRKLGKSYGVVKLDKKKREESDEDKIVTDKDGNYVFYDWVTEKEYMRWIKNVEEDKNGNYVFSNQVFEKKYNRWKKDLEINGKEAEYGICYLLYEPDLYQEDQWLPTFSGGNTEQEKNSYFGTFDSPIDVEKKITGIRYAGQWIDLSDCEYEKIQE